MIATCLLVEYIPGSFEMVQGVKSYHQSHNNGGVSFRTRSHGWGSESTKSELHLEVRTPRKAVRRIDVAPFFKENLGRLTQKRQAAIVKCMPETVELEQSGCYYGPYNRVVQDDLQVWLERVKGELKIKS